jgi:flagellar basal-body rod protein FlgC
MSMFRALDISASGLHAERTRMDVIADNIANVESGADGASAYRRKEVLLVARPWGSQRGFGSSAGGAESGGVAVAAVREDQSPPLLVYRPDDPSADAQGYVHLPNVNLPLEMVDMVAATRAYEANTAAFRAGREMLRRALDIMK